MGTSKSLDTEPQQMAEEKKSIKNLLKKPFRALFQKDKYKRESLKQNKDVVVSQNTNEPIPPKPEMQIAVLLEKFNRLELQKKEEKKHAEDVEEEDEFKNFSYILVKEEDEKRSARIDSHSSEDSGFADKCTVDSEDEKEDRNLIESLNNLKVDTDVESNSIVEAEDKKEDKKKKKLQTVYVSRGPIRNSAANFGRSLYPYGKESAENVYRQNQVNKHTFSGGQVIITEERPKSENVSEIDIAIKQVEINVQNFLHNTQQEQIDRWQIAQEFINESSRTVDDILSEFIDQSIELTNEITNYTATKCPSPNPVEEFSKADHTQEYDIDLSMIDSIENPSIFPTPPRSENIPSPMSDSQASFYPTNSDYTLSPDTSSPIYNSDYEKYQDLTSIEEYPSCVTDNVESDKERSNKKRGRSSTSSMSMKQFKDLQKEIASKFSQKACCQLNRRPCKEIFTEYLHKLKLEERKNICLKVAQLDLQACYGVLHHVLLNLSKGTDENVNMSLFMLICEKVLSMKPLLFVSDFGLSLLKAAVIRCNARPILTRYLVQCIRTVTRSDAYKPTKEYVFTEVDALGDTLVTACARGGDSYADTLAEIVRNEDKDAPLFNIHQANTDGYTALHVCCSEHSARESAAHALHVLLRHAGADLWRGDIKGGDTPLHVAVNSANCDLTIIMILFQSIDRKEWRRLAHVQNRSSVTPLEYARSAIKSASRQNYPTEVLDFLKKCR
ncbi:uncharacterized protein LOC123665953 [Melitaea cinxia]|uniref:uncharacterized protein LOC123665953 n=1 Tax=Melitaea cinxia TaxID=113334 RepID=UPI001E271ED4|nr:uncharacterized protein LOC123665953 [Melitaea cinxia]